jgi:hypothetical protein
VLRVLEEEVVVAEGLLFVLEGVLELQVPIHRHESPEVECPWVAVQCTLQLERIHSTERRFRVDKFANRKSCLGLNSGSFRLQLHKAY